MKPPSLPPLVWGSGGAPAPRRIKALLEGLGPGLHLLPASVLLWVPLSGGDEWLLVPEGGATFLPLRQGALEDPEVRGALEAVGRVFAVESGEIDGPIGERLEALLDMAADETEHMDLLAAFLADPTPEAEEALAAALEKGDWNPNLVRLYGRALRRRHLPARLPEALAHLATLPVPPWAHTLVLPEEGRLQEEEWQILPAVVVAESGDPLTESLWELLNEEYQGIMEIGGQAVAGLWHLASVEEAAALGRALRGALEALEWLRDTWGEEGDADWPDEQAWREAFPTLPTWDRKTRARKGRRVSRRRMALPPSVSPPPPREAAYEEAVLD